jgi:hypothetical protein
MRASTPVIVDPPWPRLPASLPVIVAIRDRLLTIAAVVGWVDQRVYTLEFPQSLTAPAIRLQEIDRISEMHLRGDVGIRRARIQVDAVESAAHADPYENAHAIAAAVRGDLTSGAASGLVGYRGDLSGVPIAGILAGDQREMYDAPTQLVRVEQEFLVWFHV